MACSESEVIRAGMCWPTQGSRAGLLLKDETILGVRAQVKF
jgi:hypothetical protein